MITLITLVAVARSIEKIVHWILLELCAFQIRLLDI